MNQLYIDEIIRLKEQKNATILAHYYQIPEIQELADFVGDSLELSKKAMECETELIVFCGVHFMAETAKILNPTKKVVLPDFNAGCSLADSCKADDLIKMKEQYPNHKVVTYVNCSAEIKTLSDYVCTSSNALKVINSIPENQPIIFAPDKNLGRYLIEKTGRNMVLWEGSCVVHEAFSFEKLVALYKQYPKAEIVAHPESEKHILKTAHFIGSTSQLLQYVKNSDNKEFIVATEVGILHKMQLENPQKTFIPAPSFEDNTCACSDCAYMKMNTLEKLRDCLINEKPEICLSQEVIHLAMKPLQKMFELN